MAQGERALIVGAGSGLSASLARRGAREGITLVLAAQDTQKLAPLAQETGAATIAWTRALPRRSSGCRGIGQTGTGATSSSTTRAPARAGR
jgi:NAD(P)-dependent dehydrogenase (short-subunit alcohol dehydrogenase family)